MRPPGLPTLLRRGDLLASWNPRRPLVANLVFVLFVALLELFGRGAAMAAGAGDARPPLALAVTIAGLWLVYPLALHVKLPLIAGASEAGRQGRLAAGREPWLLLGGLLMSVLAFLVVFTSFGFDLDHPLAFLCLPVATLHGLAVAFLYLTHLGSPRGEPPSWRGRWEWGADLVLVGYLWLAYAWIWEGMMTGRTPSLAGYGWPAVIPQLIAAVLLFWFVYLPLQAPFLLGLAGELEGRRGGVWWFRASFLAATVAGLWPCFQVAPFPAEPPLPRERLASHDVTFRSLGRAVRHPRKVRRLALRGELTRVPRTVSRLANVQALDLSRNRLERLPRSLRELPNLQELELSFNRLGGAALAPLAGMPLRRLGVAFNPELDAAALGDRFPELELLVVDPEQLRALREGPAPRARLAVRLPDGLAYRGTAWRKGPGAISIEERAWIDDLAVEPTEVTVGRHAECVAAGACTPAAAGEHCTWGIPGREDHPVNCVTFEQARAHCRWLGGDLPTAVQWEYAARGRGQPYPWGEAPPGTAPFGNFADEAFAHLYPTERHRILSGYDDGFATTAPAGGFPAGASPFGLLDVAGNVAEWVLGGNGGGGVRGGSWASRPGNLVPNLSFALD
ncbi:MAG TPA: SUMF1/EgtB/PvdO family nonheme iron enzyme, partial [Thermoanaerobaculia bacterium]|nr:SUMF1/EgtB/PvdO family nonheme iron enzyme [Thermoanaerobaculia bacterium]